MCRYFCRSLDLNVILPSTLQVNPISQKMKNVLQWLMSHTPYQVSIGMISNLQLLKQSELVCLPRFVYAFFVYKLTRACSVRKRSYALMRNCWEKYRSLRKRLCSGLSVNLLHFEILLSLLFCIVVLFLISAPSVLSHEQHTGIRPRNGIERHKVRSAC